MEYTEAEYADGVLRPLTRLPLKPGEHVRLLILRQPDPGRWDLARLAANGAEDSGLAEEGLADWADTLDREDQG